TKTTNAFVSRSRADMSPRFPIGVPTTYSTPSISFDAPMRLTIRATLRRRNPDRDAALGSYEPEGRVTRKVTRRERAQGLFGHPALAEARHHGGRARALHARAREVRR